MSPLAKVLLAIAGILGLVCAGEGFFYLRRVRQAPVYQNEINRMNMKQQAFMMLAGEAVEYGKTHPAIEPILSQLKDPNFGQTTNRSPAASPIKK